MSNITALTLCVAISRFPCCVLLSLSWNKHHRSHPVFGNRTYLSKHIINHTGQRCCLNICRYIETVVLSSFEWYCLQSVLVVIILKYNFLKGLNVVKCVYGQWYWELGHTFANISSVKTLVIYRIS